MRLALRVVVVVAVLGGLGAGVWGAVAVVQLRDDLAATEADLAEEQQRRRELETDVTAAVEELGEAVASVADRVGGSSFDLDDLSSRVDDLQYDVIDLQGEVSTIDSSFNRLKRCVDSINHVLSGFGSYTFC